MDKIEQIKLALENLKNAISSSEDSENFENSPVVDMKKLDALKVAILRRAEYEEYREKHYAILSHRLFTNPITNKTIARYVWDLHDMNFN